MALLLVLSFHLVGNLVWIALNQSPPSWDEANHIRRSVQYTYFIQDLVAGKPDWGMAWDSFQDGYGPLVRIISGVVMLVIGVGVVQTQIISTVFFLATIVAVYLLSKELGEAQHKVQNTTYKEIIAFGAALVFSFYQLIYAHSRWLLLDIPVTLFTTLTYLSLIRSKWGLVRKHTILAGMFAACAMLTKAQAVLYFVMPALYSLWEIVKRNWRVGILRQAQDDQHNNADVYVSPVGKKIDYSAKAIFIHMSIALLVCLLLFSLWAIPNFAHVYEYIKAGATIRLNHPDDLRSLVTWTFYLKLIINNITTLWGFLLLVPALIAFIKSKQNLKSFIISMIVGYYLWFTLISNKDLRFIYPIFPFVAYIFAAGWYYVLNKLIHGRNAILCGLVSFALMLFFAFQLVMYCILSFRWPFPKGITSFVMIPGINDITLLNTESDYPVKGYGMRTWPVVELARDLQNHFVREAKAQVFLIPNLEYFNNNTIALELTRIHANNVLLMGGVNKAKFNTQHDADIFASQFTHFVYVDGNIGPEYQWDRQLFEQIQNYVKRMRTEGRTILVNTYTLPNGQMAYWYKINK